MVPDLPRQSRFPGCSADYIEGLATGQFGSFFRDKQPGVRGINAVGKELIKIHSDYLRNKLAKLESEKKLIQEEI